MAIGRTALTGVSSKTLTDTLTIPDVSMDGGDSLKVCVIYSPAAHGNPEVFFGANNIGDHVEGKTSTSGTWRMRYFSSVLSRSITRDITIVFPNESAVACAAIGTIVHEAGKTYLTTDNENLNSTLSTSGGANPMGHPTSIIVAWHATIGPVGDAVGTSTTSMTLGTRVGTTGGDDTSNVTLQETYSILGPEITLAGSFVVDETYQIKTVGTTDFTLVGAANNLIGTQFVATGVGSGTGDAYWLEARRSRLINLALRDHMGMQGYFQPKYTFSISKMLQYHRNVNENPDWVETLVEDDNGNGFWVQINPDDLDDWSDTAIQERIAQYVSTWVVNHVDNTLSYEANTVRDTRMATFIGKEIII